MNDNDVSYVTPEEWLASSPDAAPCDFFWWGYLKFRVNKRQPKTLNGLKKVIIEECKKVPQAIINKALLSWPKRLRQIYYNKGNNIE